MINQDDFKCCSLSQLNQIINIEKTFVQKCINI